MRQNQSKNERREDKKKRKRNNYKRGQKKTDLYTTSFKKREAREERPDLSNQRIRKMDDKREERKRKSSTNKTKLLSINEPFLFLSEIVDSLYCRIVVHFFKSWRCLEKARSISQITLSNSTDDFWRGSQWLTFWIPDGEVRVHTLAGIFVLWS